MKKLSMDNKLALNLFHTDDDNPHIVLNSDYANTDEIRKVVLACPAECYRYNEDGSLTFSHLGCLECGTCRVLSLGKLVKDWNYPVGSMGISYREG